MTEQPATQDQRFDTSEPLPEIDASKIEMDKIPDIAVIRMNGKLFRQFYLKDPKFTRQDFIVPDPDDSYYDMKPNQVTFSKWDPNTQRSDTMGVVSVEPKYPGQNVNLRDMSPRDRKSTILTILAHTFLASAGSSKQ